MQNVKKWIAAVLALALILALALSTTALAAVDDTGFSDVGANDWYAEAVTYCHENKLMGGTGNAAFSPNTTMTLAMLATVLWRMKNEPAVNYLMQFSDVADNNWSRIHSLSNGSLSLPSKISSMSNSAELIFSKFFNKFSILCSSK